MQLKTTELKSFAKNRRLELYTAIVIPGGSGICKVDSGMYPFSGPSVLFLAPFQSLWISGVSRMMGEVVQFHGDFYCIECRCHGTSSPRYRSCFETWRWS
jgi:hypothetical protein